MLLLKFDHTEPLITPLLLLMTTICSQVQRTWRESSHYSPWAWNTRTVKAQGWFTELKMHVECKHPHNTRMSHSLGRYLRRRGRRSSYRILHPCIKRWRFPFDHRFLHESVWWNAFFTACSTGSLAVAGGGRNLLFFFKNARVSWKCAAFPSACNAEQGRISFHSDLFKS